jgi:N-acyl-D-amino-acid deacylase
VINLYDILIQGGYIIDGSGAPWYRGDIAIKDGIIAHIGKLDGEQAKKTIKVDGLVVAPGFIDIHSHDDLHVLENPLMDAKIRQGVTSTVIGNCGFGLYPVLPENQKLFYEYATGLFGEPEKEDLGYFELEDFFKALSLNGSTLNVSSLVAHGTLRISGMGYDNRKPTEAELKKMKNLLRQGLRSGAVGMSLGLIYPPGSFANTEELIELSKVVAEEGGIITSHMRNEAQYLLESIEEMLIIAREAKVPIEISHLKASGFPNFGKGIEAIRLISKAKLEGIDVTFDQYPYPAGSTTATILLPPWSLEGGLKKMLERIRNKEIRNQIKKDMIEGIPGSPWEPRWKIYGWDNIMICSVQKPENKKYEGNRVKDITDQFHLDPFDFILDLLEDEDGSVIMITFQQDNNDLEAIMVHELQMFGSDGLPLRGRKAHPRLYGTYPRVLGTYVRENKLLSLERAVYKMTYMPANRLGILDRGLIRPGMAADITIFNKDTIADLSTYTNPTVKPDGIEMVIVNGVVVLEEGCFTGEYPGKPLRKVSVKSSPARLENGG